MERLIMLATLFVLLVVLFGHGLLLILAVNMSHGLGFHTRWAEVLTLVALILVGGAGLGFAAWVLLGHPWNVWPVPIQVYSILCAAVALVGFPVVTVLRAFRRIPEGVTGQEHLASPSKDLVGDGESRLLRLPGNQSLDLIVRDWQVAASGLCDSLDGLSIVHLTDLHMSPRYDRRFFEHVMDEANRLEPDLVLFSGDLIEDESAVEWIEPVLGRLRARVGKLAILGNHDLLYGPEAIE
ncbi:MAG TPA: metallophosphoesterase, partial [Isosphaeraceae bacterium]|nr:metallophosphoesterase [Isosphaeraceae bacterium]